MSMKPSTGLNSGESSAGLLNKTVEEYFCKPSEFNLEKVFESARGLIFTFGKLYGKGFCTEDIYQAGSEGLMKAVKRFDSSSKNSFTTYACSLIIGEIRHYVRKENSYYMSPTLKKLQNQIDETIIKILENDIELPTIDSIAKDLNIRSQAVPEIMRAGLVPYEELQIAKITSAKYDSFELPIEDKLFLDGAIKKLSDLQKKVLYLIFYEGMTQEQAAKKLGINQRKVSRLKQSGLEKLRESVEVY